MDVVPSVGTDSGPQEALPVIVVNPNGTLSGAAMAPLGYVQVPLTPGQPYTVNPPAGARMVVLKPEGADMRYRDDGVAPTAGIGMPVGDGESLLYDVTMHQLQLTAQATGCICNMAFYGDEPDA